MPGMSDLVPRRNVEFVRGFLKKEGIPIVGERLAGASALEVFFETGTGKARVRSVKAPPPALLAQQERERIRVLRELEDPGEDSVTLF